MKIYIHDQGVYGMLVCVASSKEQAIQYFKKHHMDGENWREEDGDPIQEFEIEEGMCYVNIGDR